MNRLAACTLPAFRPASWDHLADALELHARAAARGKAGLILYPEYTSLLLAGLWEDAENIPAADQLMRLQAFHDDWVSLHRELARRHGLVVVAGSFPLRHGDGHLTNRAWICHPGGRLEHQDKIMMTRWEAEEWGVLPGEGGLRVVDLGWTKAVVAICYDVEFPLLVRRGAEAGASLICCPSNTEGWHGYWRVRTGCAARALENQCLAVMAPMVGSAPWTCLLGSTVGRAGVFGPIDVGFPEDGVLALGPEDGGLLLADAPVRRAGSVRRHGQNRNFRDWDRQPR